MHGLKRSRTCRSTESKKQQSQDGAIAARLQFVPFNLSTEQRERERKQRNEDKAEEKAGKNFRARPMPKYKFFEVEKQETPSNPTFEEFNLRTVERSQSKNRKSLPVPQEEAEFRRAKTYVFKA